MACPCATNASPRLQDWLATKGSPHSVIERCEFRNERELEALEYSSFSTKRR